jgi:hypothetical protein
MIIIHNSVNMCTGVVLAVKSWEFVVLVIFYEIMFYSVIMA